MKTDMFRKANRPAAKVIEKAIKKAGKIGIVGHVRPDGDDVGACLGMAGYIRTIKPEASVTVFLEEFSKDFEFLAGAKDVCHDFSQDIHFDLCFALDCADSARMGEAAKYFTGADERICIDHHITNTGLEGAYCLINPERSSACEVVCTVIDMNRLSKQTAECLYLGIVHDTGVFMHSNTLNETMIYAGKLIELGAEPAFIIENTFYKKTFAQNKALGRALDNAMLLLDGKLIYSFFTKEMMEEMSVKSTDLDGVIDQLRVTEGTLVSAFIYWKGCEDAYKVSLRSKEAVNVGDIAVSFGGGGHAHAAGCELSGTPEEIAQIIAKEVEKQLS